MFIARWESKWRFRGYKLILCIYLYFCFPFQQKNAEAIRHPEEEKEREYFGLDTKVILKIDKCHYSQICKSFYGKDKRLIANLYMETK